MKIYLCTREDEQLNAWKIFCGHLEDVILTKQSILDIKAEGLVSPANSFGVMSGGIDLHYRNYFGKDMEDALRKKIFEEFDGELLVGQATYVPISHPNCSYTTLISAPTMRVPSVVAHTINPYLAARSALLLAVKLGLGSITFPGLGTGTGLVTPEACAKQIAVAIEDVLISPPDRPKGLYLEHDRMIQRIVPKEWLEVQFSVRRQD
jgi:O-acetyl-ADP-ribose deacetylase (regulator of RNase III)